MLFRRSRPASGLVLIWVTSVLPVALWLMARPVDERVATWHTALGSVSKALGLVGLTLMAWAVVLAARLRLLEHFFGGLDRAYRHHHVVGGVAFILLLLHPTLLAARYASVSMERAARLWVPDIEDGPLLYGQVALYLMIPSLLATLFGHLRHTAFVRTQQVLGVLLIPAALHVLLIRGDSRSFWPLRSYLILVTGMAFLAYIYHPILTRFLTSRHRYVVKQVHALAPDVTELIVAPQSRLLAFIPGQYAFLTVHAEALGEEAHPFSLASSPREADIRFVIKHLGDWTTELARVPAGTRATIEGPYGTFSHRHGRSHRQIWVAGGIGIAPFLSMARSLDEPPRYSVDLWYGVRDDDDPFLPELVELARTRQNLRVFPVREDPDGLITAEMLDARSGLDGKEILLCGPQAMMDSLREQLMKRGVAESEIHYEDFSFR